MLLANISDFWFVACVTFEADMFYNTSAMMAMNRVVININAHLIFSLVFMFRPATAVPGEVKRSALDVSAAHTQDGQLTRSEKTRLPEVIQCRGNIFCSRIQLNYVYSHNTSRLFLVLGIVFFSIFCN